MELIQNPQTGAVTYRITGAELEPTLQSLERLRPLANEECQEVLIGTIERVQEALGHQTGNDTPWEMTGLEQTTVEVDAKLLEDGLDLYLPDVSLRSLSGWLDANNSQRHQSRIAKKMTRFINTHHMFH